MVRKHCEGPKNLRQSVKKIIGVEFFVTFCEEKCWLKKLSTIYKQLIYNWACENIDHAISWLPRMIWKALLSNY